MEPISERFASHDLGTDFGMEEDDDDSINMANDILIFQRDDDEDFFGRYDDDVRELPERDDDDLIKRASPLAKPHPIERTDTNTTVSMSSLFRIEEEDECDLLSEEDQSTITVPVRILMH